ncbi:chemotaxis protein CheA [Legionella impletisoli]|uniref:Chemotaxis protein CheA n=1 Tax=Legionella impletisoli TaxID=343510 RepID=A0A917JQY1_9GAMM|nr:chemotaxis protein CheA [Legionella impletisoli]GGI78207.1 chemotaxis protein CheA [Legionella impletisoli]
MNTDQYLELFVSEAHELLTTLNQGLIQLEKSSNDTHTLDEVFRASHTLKGNAAAMGYERVVNLAHAMENTLSLIREGQLTYTASVATELLNGVDLLQAMVEEIQSGQAPQLDEKPLIATLQELKEDAPKATSQVITNEQPAGAEEIKSTSSLKYVRINLERLESLMNLVGELHLSKIRLIKLSQSIEHEAFEKNVNELERIINQLQNETMQMRLLPLQYIFNYYPRLIRNDAQKENKIVELIFSGSDIGLDRMILDEINDPLLHILRNALSHGIESPEQRKEKGKSETGHIYVSAHREQNQVVIQVEDDGAGIDINVLKTKLLKQGLVTKESLTQLTEQELLLMIAQPGFSLTEEITERSGRGMGMSVVKRKIDAIGGSLLIQNKPDKGCIFTLRLPISMAIIHALLIRLESDTLVIPLYHILEAVKLDPKSIRNVGAQEFLPYRNEVIPLIRLGEILKFSSPQNRTESIKFMSIVVCQVNHHKLGLLVDEFLGEQEIVIKPLETSIENLDIFSGATLLADGRAALILDASTLVNHIG